MGNGRFPEEIATYMTHSYLSGALRTRQCKFYWLLRKNLLASACKASGIKRTSRHMKVSLNYCSQNGGNLYRAPYYHGNPNIGPRIIGNLDQYPHGKIIPVTSLPEANNLRHPLLAKLQEHEEHLPESSV